MGPTEERGKYYGHHREDLAGEDGDGELTACHLSLVIVVGYQYEIRLTNGQPPVSFQPPSPPGQAARNSTTPRAAAKQPEKPPQPDLITRYNLKDKLGSAAAEPSGSDATSNGGNGGKNKGGWSANREERQSTLQKRRDEMILQARKRMEAKIAAEKAAAAGGSV